MDSNLMGTPAVLTSARRTWSDVLIAPIPSAQGTAVPVAATGASVGTAFSTGRVAFGKALPAVLPAAQVAVAGAHTTDLLGHVPRGAPV